MIHRLNAGMRLIGEVSTTPTAFELTFPGPPDDDLGTVTSTGAPALVLHCLCCISIYDISNDVDSLSACLRCHHSPQTRFSDGSAS
jgi:hypothetical protein